MSMRIASAFTTLAASALFAFATSAAELRPAITVSGATVTLGDLFDNAGSAAGVVVANAPAPGYRGEISVSRISLAARRNGIDWRNDAGISHVTVDILGLNIVAERGLHALLEPAPRCPVSITRG